MFNTYKKITAAIFTIGLLAPQIASANFYVIPVGQTPIKASNVKSIVSTCLEDTSSSAVTPTTIYTVPENKVFVVTSFMFSSCNGLSYARNSSLILGSKFKINNVASNELKNFNLGIVLDAGELIEFANTNVWSGGVNAHKGIMINVNGYLSNP